MPLDTMLTSMPSPLSWRYLVAPLLLSAVPWLAAGFDDSAVAPGGTGVAVLAALGATALVTALGARLEGGGAGSVWRAHGRQAAGLYGWALVGALMQREGLTAPLGRTLLGAAAAAITMNLVVLSDHRPTAV